MSPRGRFKGAVSVSAKTLNISLVTRATGQRPVGPNQQGCPALSGDFRVPYCFFEELVALMKQNRMMLLQTKIIRTIYSSSFS